MKKETVIRSALLSLCGVLACGASSSIESNENTQLIVAPDHTATYVLVNGHDMNPCSCARPCADEELKCLRDFDVSTMCTDGLVCIEEAMRCEQNLCGGRCPNWILKCPEPQF